MSKQIAKNTFTGGLLMDANPLSSQNTVLTNALNATLVTIDGDEMILLNDIGNLKATYKENGEDVDVTLSEGFIPIGINTLNGIAYIVSFNPNTQEGEIGTFPSPQYNINENGALANDNNYNNGNNRSKLINKYLPLYNLYKGCIEGNCLVPKLDVEITNLLFPLRTTHFNFDLEHPVNVELQPSYDGSVNIIINDGKNIPRLINSRFSADEEGTWKIPDRHRNINNIYKVYEGNYEDYKEPMCVCENGEIKDGITDVKCGCTDVSCKQEIENQSLFDITTSLSKRIEQFPITVYNGVINTGNLPVGNYVLYFKYCDEDGNETDFVAESGIISIFKGNDKDPFSIDGGERDMDSNKSINITLKYIDQAYSFIKVYYSRTSAAADENRVSQAYEIIKTYPVDSNICNIIINGDEEKQEIPITSLSLQLTIVNSAESLVQIANRLFLGNVKSQELYYKELTNLSLHVVPYVTRHNSKNKIGFINPKDYQDSSGRLDDDRNFTYTHEYYNTKNIYYNVGYWNEEYYRLGIVYIFEDGSLSQVFNILGYEPFSENNAIKENRNLDGVLDRSEEITSKIITKSDFEIEDIKYNDDGFFNEGDIPSFLRVNGLNADGYIVKNTINAKGIIRINDDEIETYKQDIVENKRLNKLSVAKEDISNNYIYNLGVYINENLINELKKYCVKGFFIVRQKRIPTILAQGFTMPWDKEAKIPIIEYWSTRHDFSRGMTVSSEGSGTNDGIKYSKINPITKGFYIGKYSNSTYNPVERRCDVVESFLQLNAADSFGMTDPKDTNKIDTQDDEHWTNQCYNRGSAVHHYYLLRLHEILPLTIDDEMIHKVSKSSDAKDSDYKLVHFKIKISGKWYTEGDKGTTESTQPADYIEDESEYPEDYGMDLLNTYVYHLKNNLLYEMGEYYGKSQSEIDYATDKKTAYKMMITTISAWYCSDIDANSQNWKPLTVTPYYDAYDCYDETNSSGETTVVVCKVVGLNDGSETLNELASINKVKIEEGSQTTSYEKFETDLTVGHGYSTINTYFSGLMVHRLTGEVWEAPIPENYRVYTGQNNLQNVPLTYIANYYMNGRLNWKMLFHVDDNDYKYAKTRAEVLRDVSKATQKHFWNLYKYCDKLQLTAVCPEFEVKQPFFNQLFTGSEYYCKYNKYQYGILHRKSTNERYYYLDVASDKRLTWKITKDSDLHSIANYYDEYKKYAMAEGVWLQEGNFLDYKLRPYKIVSVTDSVPVVAIDNTVFKSVLGSEQEAYRFSFINEEHAPKRAFKHIHAGSDRDKSLCNTENKTDFNLARGYYSPYLGMVCVEHGDNYDKYADDKYWDNEKGRGYGRNFTIYDSTYLNDFITNAKIRIQDSSPYYSISERIVFDVKYNNDVSGLKQDKYIQYDLYRGDCFLYTFTHRLNRNFNDPVAPSNDHIINPTTWRDHFRPDETDTESTEGTSKLSKINRGDVNAVKLGSWITVKGRSSYNLSIRSLDERYTAEAAMMGRARGFYPLQQASADGGYKIPNSYLINDGFGSTVGEKTYVTLPEAPYYNNVFEDRIIYSDVNIQDAYKNGYRTFKSASITDYTKLYGKIVKLIDWLGNILCIFEHAVGILPVNERVESGQGVGGPVFIDNNKTISDIPTIISDKFGSYWKDSIVKTPYAAYGIDTSTKKIWKVTGSKATPTLTVISDFKIENFLKEHLKIDDTEQQIQIALKNIKSHYNQAKSDIIFTFYMSKEYDRTKVEDRDKFDEEAWSLCLNEITADHATNSSGNFVTFYSWIPLESFNLNNKFYSFDRSLIRGVLSFYDLELIPNNKLINYIGKPVYNSDGEIINESEIDYCNPTESYYTKKYNYPKECMTGLNLWEHNNPFIRPLPTHWYGHQHPFEFEFVVVEDPSVLKIYEDLKIISNNAKPESFHFSITGDNYEFTEDMPNIYYRQEATKELYGKLGCPISYNKDYIKVHPNQLVKSTIFPLYYNRIDVYDNIYDLYQLMTGDYRDYQNLSGTEVYRNPRSRKFELVTHIKNTPIDGEWIRITKENAKSLLKDKYDTSKDFDKQLEALYNLYYSTFNISNRDCNLKFKKIKNPEEAFECGDNNYWYYLWVPQSRLRGNSHYKEDRWNIQIPTITLMLKNEDRWTSSDNYAEQNLEVPPLVLNWVPKLKDYEITGEKLPNTYSIGQISTDKWTFRKEAKLRDKYCKIKVRYSGEELAIISAVLTTFNISYA